MNHKRISVWFALACFAFNLLGFSASAHAGPKSKGVLGAVAPRHVRPSLGKLQKKIQSAATSAARRQAVQALIDKLQRLIKQAPDDPHRPIWESTLAQTLILNVLAGEYDQAIVFAQFGVLSQAQAEALDRFAPRALEAIDAAAGAVNALQEKPASGKPLLKSLPPALQTALIQDYAEQRIPFFGAWAELAVAVEPNTAPYFADLGKPADRQHIKNQKTNPNAERQRLAKDVISRLRALTGEGQPQALRFESLILIGRAQLILNNGAKAQNAFDTVLGGGAKGLSKLVAQLGKAKALCLQKKDRQALSLLNGAASENAVVGHALFGLLVADAKYHLLIDQAKRAGDKKAAINKAYAVYHDFLNQRWLGKSAKTLRQYIARRWVYHLADEKPTSLPPAVCLAIGRLERMRGQNDAIRAHKQDKQPLKTQADDQLHKAVDFLNVLTGKSLPANIRARGMYNLALAHYWLNRRNLANLIHVAGTFTTVADQMPDQPIAADAINNAVFLLHQLYVLTPQPSGAAKAYKHAANVLFDKFPVSKTAANERLFFARQVLIPAGQYTQAIKMVDQIPFDNPHYLPGQRFRLEWMQAQFDHRSSKPGMVSPTAKQLLTAAKALRQEAESAIQAGGSKTRLAAAKKAAGQATLIEAEMIARQGHPAQAVKLIASFDKQYAGDDQLIQQADRQRLLFLVADRRIAAAGNFAEHLIQQKPSQGAWIVDSVFNQITTQVDRLRTRAKNHPMAADHHQWLNEAQDRAEIATRLAQLLDNWAERQHKMGKQLLPYQLMLVRSQLAAGDPDQAVKQLKPLIKAYPDQAQVIELQADALFARGSDASLTEAAKYYDQLIAGLNPPYPEMYWHAWVRRLRINARLDKDTQDIPLRVRQLQRTDPNLGGQPYRRELLSLKNRYKAD